MPGLREGRRFMGHRGRNRRYQDLFLRQRRPERRRRRRARSPYADPPHPRQRPGGPKGGSLDRGRALWHLRRHQPGLRVAGRRRHRAGMAARGDQTDGWGQGLRSHTDLVTGPVAVTAHQTIFTARQRRKAAEPGQRPPQINTCHAYAEDSSIVQRQWPEFYKKAE